MGRSILKHVKNNHSLDKHYQYWARQRRGEYGEFAPPLQIVSFGSEQWHPGRSLERVHSEICGIEYVRAGEVAFTQDGSSYTVRRGEVYILRRGVGHRYTAVGTKPLHKYYIAIEGALVESMLLAGELETCDHVVPPVPRRIERLFEEIRATMHRKPLGFVVELSTLAYRLLVELSHSIAHRYPEPLRAAIEFIDRNLTRTLTAGEIQAASGVSATHLNRLFAQHIGLAPKQFFIRHKMAWAKHLLAENRFAVKQVAATLGFEDPLYFSAQFRKHVGLSPRRYRASRISRKPASGRP